MNIRPKILLKSGRQQEPIRVPLSDLIGYAPSTVLTLNTSAGSSTLSVATTLGLESASIILIEEDGTLNAEICYIDTGTPPAGTTIVITGTTLFPHSSSVTVRSIEFDQVEFSNSDINPSNGYVLSLSNITPNKDTTDWNDIGSSPNTYYFARFYNSTTNFYTDYSDPCPVEGYSLLSARNVIETALGEINKKTSETLSDEFAFQQLDNCQTEVLRELKRWSFMQKFNAIVGETTTGSWKVAMPADIDDPNTNKSIYNFKLGGNPKLYWVDKEKWDDMMADMVFNTLASDINIGDSIIPLIDSSDFDSTGAIQIGANIYDYIANDTSAGYLTLSTPIVVGNLALQGADVFQHIQTGMPQYWTTFGGNIYYFPTTAAEYDKKNLYMDYYIKQTMIKHDSDLLIIPDQMVAVYYLCWKFLKRLASGADNSDTQAYQKLYTDRKNMMKNKETMNRTFQLKPTINNINMNDNSGDTRQIRGGNFPGTGF